MADDDRQPRSSAVMWPVIISVFVAMIQFVGYGIWIGGMSKQIDINTDWIRARNIANLDSRLAVIESRLNQIDEHLRSIDSSVTYLKETKGLPR